MCIRDRICTMEKTIAKNKFKMQRKFRWLIKVNDVSVFTAPMKESKKPVLSGVRPLTLTFTTKEQYDKLVPAGYMAVASEADTTIEAEFDKDITKAQERLLKMVQAEKELLASEAGAFLERVSRLRALVLEELPSMDNEETFVPTLTREISAEQDTLPVWQYSPEGCDAVPELGSVSGWLTYEEDARALLEAAYSAKTAEVQLPIQNVAYTVSLRQPEEDGCMLQTNPETGTSRFVRRVVQLDKVAQEAALAEGVATLSAILGGAQPEEALVALLKHHPARDNLETVMNTLFAEDFNPLLWLQRNQQAEDTRSELAGLPRSHVVEEWVCWCGSLEKMSQNKCAVCQQPRQPDAKIVARQASSTEVLHRLSDKVTPYKEAVEEARQLCFLLQAPAVVWEYVPPGQNKWHSFSRDDIAKIERWCQEGGEPTVEVHLDGHGKYIVDMEQFRMQKKNPGMGFQGGSAIQPVRRRNLGTCVSKLYETASLTQAQAAELLAKLQEKLDAVTALVTKHAETSVEESGDGVEACSWPICGVCTFMNEVTASHCEMCQTQAPPAIANPFADMSDKHWVCDKCDSKNPDNATGCMYLSLIHISEPTRPY
eukprot:TRINITY_DN7018_c0_g1_i1.p1 TRINITY_DN7018_c0_g1~~TRINITY_DN7018_c0_g1_i1.p1  ORF type:complete len:599 (-),score=163.82 TRINITY_DN7018_c0_g1_i1:76-1872(-)